MTSKTKLQILASVAVVALAAGMAFLLVTFAPDADRVEPEVSPTPVRIVTAQREKANSLVEANGTVQAAERVALVPQVSGKITWVSDDLVPGGRFTKGQMIAQIDARDYELAVQVERSRVRQAELELKLEQGRQGIAAREWALLGDGRDPAQAPLALRGPQLAVAEEALRAAQSGLGRAELALERTRLVAPFNAVVIDEALDVGQVVAPGAPAATLVGTDRFWVRVSLAMEDMANLSLENGPVGAAATVVQSLPDGGIVREGVVRQLGGQLDPQTRTATVIVEIEDPLSGPSGTLPLLPGAYVEVDITGRPMEGVVRIPRVALRDGGTVLMVAEGDRLGTVEVDVLWGTGSDVYVAGLDDGVRVVTSALSVPIDGMPLQVLGNEESARSPDRGQGGEL